MLVDVNVDVDAYANDVETLRSTVKTSKLTARLARRQARRRGFEEKSKGRLDF